ncbi:hypothetical protein ACFLYO_10235 [Chloroflexota bacterium]
MYTVRADKTKNRMYLVIEGFLNVEEAQEAGAAAKVVIDQLQPGFDLISDMRTFKPGSPQVAAIMAESQIYGIQHGINRTVRIVDKDTLGAMQWARISRETGAVVLGASSVEEAEKLLDE